MTETQTVDLAAWLTRIWDERVEQLTRVTAAWPETAEKVYNEVYSLALPLTDADDPSDWDVRVRREEALHIAASSPARELARIAADRKILELHGVEWRQRPDHEIGDSDDPWCGACLDEDYPCATLRLLASPYKGREGWQEAWE